MLSRVLTLRELQIGTTKGTGGDVLILEEAAYCDPEFFYETLAPILLIERTSLLAISTLTSEINFYTRLIKMRDTTTGEPIFHTMQIQLACEKCKEDGNSESCVHLLHLAPRWQSTERHRRLKTIMQDRPDLIQSELAGLAFDSLQQAFSASDIDTMFSSPCPVALFQQEIYLVVDPAAGGPSSDYCILTLTRERGIVTVRFFHALRYTVRSISNISMLLQRSFLSHWSMFSRKSM